MTRFLSIKTAEGCAWRGLYLYLRDKQLGRIVLDPNGGCKPRLDIAIPVGWYLSCAKLRYPRLFVIKIPLPYIKWKWPCGRLRLCLYKLSSRFYHNLDGRYGWYGKYKINFR